MTGTSHLSSAPQRALTIIELLIVVAIIAILAMIAIPSLLSAQTRSKVSRVKADQRTMAVAIEAYATDQKDYPGVDFPNMAVPHGLSANYPAAGMTTPVAYLTSIPNDPFGGTLSPEDSQGSNLNYWYATKTFYEDTTRHVLYPWLVTYDAGSADAPGLYTPKWNLQSRGPDLILKKRAGGYGNLEVDQPMKWQYDPSNGTVSAGNIVRVGP
ncbi:MAG: prepilin-type N-terminal cleavage/methylation domain-containing protein [Candidatus Sumerlaeaceae bacterium]